LSLSTRSPDPRYRGSHPVLLHAETEIQPALGSRPQPGAAQERAAAATECHQGRLLAHYQPRPPWPIELAVFLFGTVDQPHGPAHPFGNTEPGPRSRLVREKSLRPPRKPARVVALADRYNTVYAGAVRLVGAA